MSLVNNQVARRKQGSAGPAAAQLVELHLRNVRCLHHKSQVRITLALNIYRVAQAPLKYTVMARARAASDLESGQVSYGVEERHKSP
jgi:hypothetical protein